MRLVLICFLIFQVFSATVNLKTGDGSVYEVERSAANRAGLLRKILANVEDGAEVPIPIAQGAVLEKAIEIMKYVNERADLQNGENNAVDANECFEKPLQSSEPAFVSACKDQGLETFIEGDYYNNDLEMLKQLVKAGHHLGFNFMKELYMMKSASNIKAQAEAHQNK